MKGERFNPPYRPSVNPKVIFISCDHSHLQPSKKGLEVANPVMRILITWTAQATYFHYPQKHLWNSRGNIIAMSTRYHF